jgi:hypothetical protein
MIKHFAPLDQYQPFIDEFGRVTPEWYSWLKQLCDELNRLRDIEVRVAAARALPEVPRRPTGPPYDYGGVDG